MELKVIILMKNLVIQVILFIKMQMIFGQEMEKFLIILAFLNLILQMIVI